MWVEFVVGFRPCSEGSSLFTSVFLPFTKTSTCKFQFDRKCMAPAHKLLALNTTGLNKGNYFFFDLEELKDS